MTNVEGAPPAAPTKDSVRSTIRKRENLDNVRILIALIIVGVLIAFVIANSRRVDIHFIFFNSSVQLIWVLVVTALLGAAADRLLVWRKAKIRRQITKKARE